jgi:hypothetical protein
MVTVWTCGGPPTAELKLTLAGLMLNPGVLPPFTLSVTRMLAWSPNESVTVAVPLTVPAGRLLTAPVNPNRKLVPIGTCCSGFAALPFRIGVSQFALLLVETL